MTPRRGFFKLVAGAALVPVVAKIGAASSYPVLWGDGEHNDTEALQALLDGEVVEFAQSEAAKGAGWFGDVLIVPFGVYRMDKFVKLRDPSGGELIGKTFDFNNSTIIYTKVQPQSIYVMYASHCTILNGTFHNGTGETHDT